MKWMIASDLHGAAGFVRRLLERFEQEGVDRLLLLGDILYHGPRNDLPPEYAPKEVIALLTPYKDRIFCVRGNCDTEVDQMVLPFPILADYAVLSQGNRLIYATHGHVYNHQNLPPLQPGDVLLMGHTHVPMAKEENGLLYDPGRGNIELERPGRKNLSEPQSLNKKSPGWGIFCYGMI